MSREMKVGEVFHASQHASNYFYLVYNRTLSEDRDYFIYDVVCLFSYAPSYLSNPSSKYFFFSSSLFGYLYTRDRLDEFPNLIKQLLSAGHILSLDGNDVDTEFISYALKYRGDTLPLLALDAYPKEIHRWAPYFMDPMNFPIFKPSLPIIRLE